MKKREEDRMEGRFWTASPLDFRYYGADKQIFERLYPYVSESAYIKYQLKVEATLATMLADWKVCTKEQANEIVEACERVSPSDVYEEEQRVHHVVRAMVNCVQKEVSASARPFVHLFATSNDITDTATALRLKDLTINVIMPDLVDLEELLISLARQYADVPQIGRTHGKHAEPVTFGFYIATYVDRLLGRIKKIVDSAENLRGKFSGSVGAYNGLSLLNREDPALFEKQLLDKLGLRPSDGSISTQIVEPEYVTDLAFAIISSFSVLANMADDIRHLHRTEIAEVQERYGVQDVGSSTMPHKVNPRDFEHVKSMWKATMPRMITVFMDQISEHQRDLTNSASGRFLTESFITFDYSVARLSAALKKIDVDKMKMRSNLESSRDRIISEPLYILLAMNGFSDAYNHVRELVEESERTNTALTELIRKDPGIQPILNDLKQDQLEVLRDPSRYVGASGQRARIVAQQAEDEIGMILSRYMKGTVDGSSVGDFRNKRRPSYAHMGTVQQEFIAANDERQHNLAGKTRSNFS